MSYVMPTLALVGSANVVVEKIPTAGVFDGAPQVMFNRYDSAAFIEAEW